MTVRRHALKSYKHLSVPVSYKVLDDKNLYDARNVFDNRGVTETRYGIKRYNTTSLGGPVLSLSYFKLSSGVSYKLAKVGTVLYSVLASGASTAIKTGLSATTKHRAVTLNDRHIIAIEGDGLFSYNGTTFTALGQAPPVAPTAVIAAGGTTLDISTNFQVGITYYSSVTGFESNISSPSAICTSGIAGGNRQISVSAIPTTATNGTIDKIRVYLKNLGAETISANPYLYVAEIALSAGSYTIANKTVSTITPPVNNAPPQAGGGKYIALFGNKIAYAGNSSFLGEVFISEEYLPDAFSDVAANQVVIQASGQGPITGIGAGLFNDSVLNPFLAIFKKSTVTIYSDINNVPTVNMIDAHVGCISHETIRVRNGSVAFMGESGWHVITNGQIAKDDTGVPARLGGGTIDDIFTRPGWTNELNIPQASSFFSVYNSVDTQYMTFVCEGANTSIFKAYIYEERINGFRVFEFKTALTCGYEAEDDNGYQIILLGDSTGTVFTYSQRNSRSDENNSGQPQTIPVSVFLPYIQPGEDSSSYNFRTLTLRALSSANPITVRASQTFSLSGYNSFSYDFPNTGTGFVLDVSQLDVDILGDERIPVTIMADLNLTGETLLLGFFQDILDANISLISSQVSLNKNGGRNS